MRDDSICLKCGCRSIREHLYMYTKTNSPFVRLCFRTCAKLRGVSAQQEKFVQCGGTFRGLTQKADLTLLLGPT